jgi:hypothetical protein
MNRNVVLIVLAAVGCALLGCCGLGGLGAFAGVQGYKQASANIGVEVSPMLTQLLKSMDSAEVRKHMTAEALKYEPADVTKTFYDGYDKQFGKLTSLGTAKMTSIKTNSVNGRTTEEATVTFESSFEKADGDVTAEVVKGPDGVWKIRKLRVLSAK